MILAQDNPLLSDIQLMLGLKQGEEHSLEPLIRRYYAAVVRLLNSRVRNTAIAEELAQDVFLKVYRARGSYQPSGAFAGWLYRIAANRAVNWARDSRRERASLPLDQFVATQAARGATPEQELLRAEMHRRVRAAVRALPERQRLAVFLHKYGELEYTQIAAILGCSLSAVKALLNRAYATLRQSLSAAPTAQ